MSLFDIIKYSNTDLGSKDELKALPEELLDLYWKNFAHLNHVDKCTELAYWYRDYRYHKTPRKDYSKAFNEALKEYSARDEE
jgi:hypothetical protein